MRAFVDHGEGMEEYGIGEVAPIEIPVVADVLRESGAWIRDFQGDVALYAYSGYRIESDSISGRGRVVFLFGPDEM